MRYLKRGYHVAVDPNAIVEEMRQLFQERNRMLLPGEHSFIQDQLKYLLRPSGPPVDPTVFLGFFQEIRKKMAVNDTWQLQPLVRTYLGMETSQRECWKQGDLQLCVKDIPASLSVEYPEGELTKRLHLELTMAPRAREAGEAAYVAVLMFLDAKVIPAGVVYSTGASSEEETLGPVWSCPAVEVAATSNDLSIWESITFNMSYYDPDVTMDRHVCGGARVSGAAGGAVAWDLSRCVTLGRGPGGGGPSRCQCRGPGLFAFIRLPEIQTAESAKKRVVMVAALTCCAVILLLLILLCLCLQSSASSRPSPRLRGMPRQSNGECILMNPLNTRNTSYLPCFSVNKNDLEITYNPNASVPPSCSESSESINVRKRTVEFFLDPAGSFRRGVTTAVVCQGLPGHSDDMTNSQQIATNIREWHYGRQYGNVFGLSESEHRQRWGSHLLLESDYVTPDSLHDLGDEVDVSDPDEC